MRIILIMLLMLNLASAKKVALVIGNSNYNQGYLPNPTKDADLIAQKLRDVGFTVTLKNNIETAEGMKSIINNFSKTLKKDDIAVVYYAGHGVQCKGQNYLIPTTENILKGIQLKSKALDLDFLIEEVSNIKLAILMLDACRNNTYPSCTRSIFRGLAQPSEPKKSGGMIISFATAENQTVEDGDGDHSPYALALSKFINQEISIESFFKKVGEEVSSSSSQEPVLTHKFYGSFSFGKKIYNDNNFVVSTVNLNKVEKIVYENRSQDIVASPLVVQPIFSNVGVKWITPNNTVCLANGGKIHKGVCKSKWKDAKKICRVSGGRLPRIDELREVVSGCGGTIDKWRENIKNRDYFNCYKNKGLLYGPYWSSSIHETFYNALTVSFGQGTDSSASINHNHHYVLCMKDSI